MSLRGKEVRPFIDPDLHEKLAIIAAHKGDKKLAETAARILEKGIVAEWHEVSMLLERSARLGKRWKVMEAAAEPDLFKGK